MRLSTHSVGKGHGMGSVFALAACLLALCISQAVVVSEKHKFVGFNKHYDSCVNEAIQASPNTSEESHIFFHGLVPRTFVLTFIVKLAEDIATSDEGTAGAVDIELKYLELLVTKIMSSLDRDFSKVVAEKWKKLAADSGNHYRVYMNPELIPGCGETNEESRDIFQRIVDKTETYQYSMHDFTEKLRQNSNDPQILDEVSGKEPLSEEILLQVKTCIEKYIEYMQVLSRPQLVLEEFYTVMGENPLESPQRLRSQAVEASLEGLLSCHNNHYHDCIEEAIQECPHTGEEDKNFFRNLVPKIFSDEDFLFTYIGHLKQHIDSYELLDDQTRLALNDILLKYVGLLMMKIIGDVEGTDFPKVLMEKWERLPTHYGKRYKIYLRPWLIPGCRSTNQNSHKIFLDIVSESIEAAESMSDYIGNLRVNKEKAKTSYTDLDDKTLSDLDTIVERYIGYIEGITQLDLLLEEFGRVFDDKSTGSPRLLPKLAVASSREDVFARYNKDHKVFIAEAIKGSEGLRAAEICLTKVKAIFSTNDLIKNVDKLTTEIRREEASYGFLTRNEVRLIIFKFLELLLTKTLTDLKGEDFPQVVAENWKQIWPGTQYIFEPYRNPDEIHGCFGTNDESHERFKKIVEASLKISTTMQEFISNLGRKSKDENVRSRTTRSDLNTILKNYVDYLENASKVEFLLEVLKEVPSDDNHEEALKSPVKKQRIH